MPELFKTNLLPFVVVDVLALLGGGLFIWRAVRRVWRNAAGRRSSSRTEDPRGRQFEQGLAMQCALDVSYYLSRLALMFSANLLGLAGVIFTAVGMLAAPQPGSPISPGLWLAIASASMLMFVALTAWSLFRTVRLARKVMEIRRRLRPESEQGPHPPAA